MTIDRPERPLNIIMIASSTGGPKTLWEIFEACPKLDCCILIVQHMPGYINERMCATTQRRVAMNVKLANEKELLAHNTIYYAPSEKHLELVGNRVARCVDGPRVNHVRPSADVLMRSLVRGNDHLTGIVLTGMGKDGAQGIRHIKGIGGRTIAQTEKTSAIASMPKAAIDTGCVDAILSPTEIREAIVQIGKGKSPW